MAKAKKAIKEENKKKVAKAKKLVTKPAAKARITPKTAVAAAPKPVKRAQAKERGIIKKEKHLTPPLPKKEILSKPAERGKGEIVREAVSVIPKAAAVKKTQIIKEEIAPEVATDKEAAKEVRKETLPLKDNIPEARVALEPELKELELTLPITVKDLAVRLQQKPSFLIKALMNIKIMAGINQTLAEEAVANICRQFGFRIKRALGEEEIALRIHEEKDELESLRSRSPIVTFMGHVDHGKTSLLDAIRKTKVVESEHGGITQHIGAYRVLLPTGEITFLDTPGHEAFTAMRARGASITDIVVLVVAADDGIMPQTQEAIDHARAAGVPIVVAINKIDKPQANIDSVKKQLSELNLVPEDWGGKTITVPVSAKSGEGIDNLLEMILLEAQMLELKANPKRLAKGVVIEAKLSKGRGPVATLLIQNGTLHLNENIIVGNYYGKVRAMFNDLKQAVTEVGPSCPVEILGIAGIPEAGEQFFVIADEKQAKEFAAKRQELERQQQIKIIKRISLEDLHAQIEEGKLKELKLVIKADVQGSTEAIKNTLDKINVSEIRLDIIHIGIGNINSSDVILAVASNALILGFNVSVDQRAKELNEKEGVDIRTYNIIYELANDIKAAIEGMLEPKIKKVFMGRAEVRKVFKLSRAGTVAGCFLTKGKIARTNSISLVRNGQVVFEGKLSSLKRFKDDVREVAEGFECGMAIGGFDNLMEGDTIEAYEIEKIARKLE